MRELTRQLQATNASLAGRVAERTAALAQANRELQAEIAERQQQEQQRQKSLGRRSRHLWLSSQVAQDIAANTDLQTLYRQVVTLLKEQFGFYYAQLFRHDPELNELALVAGYGKRGKQMLAEGFRVRKGTGLVGLAAATCASILRSDVSTDPDWRAHPLLPHTQGELAVPIKLGPADVTAQATALKSFIDLGFHGFITFAMDVAAVALVARQALAAGRHVVTLNGDLGEDNQTIWVGIEEFEAGYMQIFQNLILNAVIFNRSAPKRIELGWRPAESGQYELYVRDNGIGIDPRYQAQIFKVFQRLHTRQEYEGTGIGLAIVQKAASTLQGSVRVESTPGAGSTFFVTLPRRSELG